MLRIIKDESGNRSVIIEKEIDRFVMSSAYDPNKKVHHSDGTLLHGEYVFKSKIKECYERVRNYSNR